MRKLARAAAGIATMVATTTLVGGGMAQASTGPATAETTREAAQATISMDVRPQETYHSWYWQLEPCQRAGIDLMYNDPSVTDYRCQFVGLYYRLLVTYR